MRDNLLHRQPSAHQGDHLVKVARAKAARPQNGELAADEVLPGVQRKLVTDPDDDQRAPHLERVQPLLRDDLTAYAVKGDVQAAAPGPVQERLLYAVGRRAIGMARVEGQIGTQAAGHVKAIVVQVQDRHLRAKAFGHHQCAQPDRARAPDAYPVPGQQLGALDGAERRAQHVDQQRSHLVRHVVGDRRAARLGDAHVLGKAAVPLKADDL